ncbi:MAG: hypothetical protein N2652_09135 [Kiritimatiellae bacterium]|nr:hypothetical protein [Kiritimatiellia bacterium]
MKREAKLLLEKATDSLVLAIELFNRPYDRGRVSGTLILMDHAFEMLMKAAILHRGGRIREKRAKETIGFDTCVRRSLSDGKIKYLTAEQALVLQAINGLRDAAQHHLLDISEGQLYIHVQSGVTLFRDLLKSVFDKDLASCLPKRVLPVSISPPTDLATLFDSEIEEVKKLLQPGRRRRIEAVARLRPLWILDATIRGEKSQPSESDLRRIGREIVNGRAWVDLFQGATAVEIAAVGTGPSLSLRLSKKEGIPILLVPEGTPGASVVAVKRVNELDYYNLGAKQLAEHLGLTTPKTIAVVDYLGLRNDSECYKEIKIGKATFKRYSQNAIQRIREALKEKSAEEIWNERAKKSKGVK